MTDHCNDLKCTIGKCVASYVRICTKNVRKLSKGTSSSGNCNDNTNTSKNEVCLNFM